MPVRCSWKPRRIGSDDCACTYQGKLAAAAPAAMPFSSVRRLGAPIVSVIVPTPPLSFRPRVWGAGGVVHEFPAAGRTGRGSRRPRRAARAGGRRRTRGSVQPAVVVPGRVGKRDDADGVLSVGRSPGPHGGGDAAPGGRAEVPALGVAADGEQELEAGEPREERRAPGFGAFAAGRQVAAVRALAGEAESHRDDGDAPGVVEGGLVEAEPGAETGAGRVVERAAAGVDAGAGRLAGDAEARGCRDLEDRARLVRQRVAVAGRVAADPAAADGGEQGVEGCVGGHEPVPAAG